MNDSDDGITITSATGNRTFTPEQKAEARRIAMRTGGILRMAMAEKGLSDKTLAAMLEVDPQELRAQLLGEAWEDYLPLAAMCLALGIKMDLQTTSN